MPATKQRLPRFRRAPEAAGVFQITPRDIEILRHVAQHRFIRSECLTKLVSGSAQQVLRRLHLLYHHGYLERPRAQLDYFHAGGSRSLVYGLASRGAGRLRRDLNMPFDRMDWTGKSKKAGRVFLEHVLLTSDIMAAIEQACRRTPGIRLLSPTDLPAQSNGKARREPLHWSVNLSTRHRLGVVPDRVFGLEFANADGEQERAWFFLEADRSTMPVARQKLNQSSVFRKLLAYEATWTQNLHRTRLGLQRFRVLTVTGSAERARHMLRTCEQLERGHGLFLFTDAATLLASADVLKHRWLGVREPADATLL